MHACIHTYIHTDIHTYIQTDIQTYRHTDIHIYIHTYIQTYTHAYIHTYIHTNTYTNRYACTLLSLLKRSTENHQNPHPPPQGEEPEKATTYNLIRHTYLYCTSSKYMAMTPSYNDTFVYAMYFMCRTTIVCV